MRKILSGRVSCFRMALVVSLLFLVAAGVTLASTGGEGGHGGEAKGWVAMDTYRVMNFAVLAIGLFLILRKPIAQSLSSRIQTIKEQLADLEARKAEAEKRLGEYNQRLSLMEKEAQQIAEEYVRQGEEAKARILQEATLAAEKLEAQAKRNIENEFERAKASLREDVLEKALLKAEEVVRAKITKEDQNRLVDEYLQKVVA